MLVALSFHFVSPFSSISPNYWEIVNSRFLNLALLCTSLTTKGAVKLPEGEDLNEWLAANSKYTLRYRTTLFTLITKALTFLNFLPLTHSITHSLTNLLTLSGRFLQRNQLNLGHRLRHRRVAVHWPGQRLSQRLRVPLGRRTPVQITDLLLRPGVHRLRYDVGRTRDQRREAISDDLVYVIVC